MPSDAQEKIDCHCHVFDPARFAYAASAPYRPSGSEIAPYEALVAAFDAHEVRHALIVQPNSGYDRDNACLLDALRRGAGRFRGIAAAGLDASRDQLAELQGQGVVGVAINVALYGLEPFRGLAALGDRLADLGMFLNLQAEADQWLGLCAELEGTAAHLLIDHCGRPDPARGLDQPGFQKILALGRAGRASVKISGYAKFSSGLFPYSDAQVYVTTLIEAFSARNCLWASDWPFLRAAQRLDYGPMIALFEQFAPDAAARRAIYWDNPRRLFGFS